MQFAETRPTEASFRSMATKIQVTFNAGPDKDADFHRDLNRLKAVFSKTELSCSRFLDSSDLSKINSTPDSWHETSSTTFDAIQAAYKAYTDTNGLFDPRILSDLIRLGYEVSWTKAVPGSRSGDSPFGRPALDTWRAKFKNPNQVHIGGLPIDLGGIGKGLALRWSAASISRDQSNFLIDAGGDCICAGDAPEMSGWNIGVQNPVDIEGQPVAVLNVSDRSVCTSSTAVRKWWRNGAYKHHLISPETGEPGGKDLASVTVSLEDPAESEVWSKSLFLMGRDKIRDFSERLQIPTLWICDNGEVVVNSQMEPFVSWLDSD